MVMCKNAPTCQRKEGLHQDTGYCRACQKTYEEALNSGAPNLSSLASFPPAALSLVQTGNIDQINNVAEQIKNKQPVDPSECMLAMFGLVANLTNTMNNVETKIETVNNLAHNNETRITALEAKVGDKEECAIPRSIAIQNLPKYDTCDDESTVKEVIRNINVEGVNHETDVIKVIRKGYKPKNGNENEKLGTVLVELSSSEVRTKIMKNKKSLENTNLKYIKIRNMKSQPEVNQSYFNRQVLKMIPGGDQFYITGNGSLRPQTRPSAPQQTQQGPGPNQAPTGFQHSQQGLGPHQAPAGLQFQQGQIQQPTPQQLWHQPQLASAPVLRPAVFNYQQPPPNQGVHPLSAGWGARPAPSQGHGGQH